MGWLNECGIRIESNRIVVGDRVGVNLLPRILFVCMVRRRGIIEGYQPGRTRGGTGVKLRCDVVVVGSEKRRWEDIV